jgi:hypothetical protein
MNFVLACFLALFAVASAFVVPNQAVHRRSMSLFAATEEKAASLVSGEELEMMLQELDQPLVIDAYATWW